ncbi:CoA pyrophosphatase [Peptoniphilus sp. GNH]|nr:CoA pyrophosphatase [Peptoniphilus sp. GNH]
MKNKEALNKIASIVERHRPSIIDAGDKYAVFIPLIEVDGKICLLYEVRSASLRRQPGEISFPGGKIDKGEGAGQAALRETCEELLLTRQKLEYFGELDFIYTQSGTQIYCFAGLIKDITLENIRPNKDEVEKVFCIPLDYLIETEPEVHSLDIGILKSDTFPYDLIPGGKAYKFAKGVHKIYFYKYAGYLVWGLTAKLTYNFIKILKSNKFWR